MKNQNNMHITPCSKEYKAQLNEANKGLSVVQEPKGELKKMSKNEEMDEEMYCEDTAKRNLELDNVE